ncbi:pyruvate formate-lyase-activating protein [Occultella kanbiaonis]|uniref:pyruvate formate-lyase-activating protein n=1 Tax=Occultella kanbiaonis TaxID=2675754 RepID=UPI0012B70D35|nr:pyruvate formate-lyase-activating protein [Occultella kanbiaonis]
MVVTAPGPDVRAVAGGRAPEVAREDRSVRLARIRLGELGSVHSWELVTAVDGPGTRMTLFLSGCPLRCLYCHNPDTWRIRDGRLTDVAEVLTRVARYRHVFAATGGGLTVSGGEALMQPTFLGRILAGAKELGVHTTLDTSGYLGANATDVMLADTDLVLLDVKSGDPNTYRRVTGRDLGPTLRFGRRLSDAGIATWIRFVLVPGLTDDPDNVALVADYAASLPSVERVEVLPLHQMGREKWARCGIPYELADTRPPTAELTQRVRDQFAARGLLVF